jgi:YidC/Oxa1 family membrane protein insertase
MMDKKTILIVVGCLLALIVWQKVVDKLFPPSPKRAAPVITEAAPTNEAPARIEAAAPEVAETAEEPVAEIESPRPAERIVVLENDRVRVELTTWGGGIRSVELLAHRSNGGGNVILNGPEFVPALALEGIAGAGTNGTYEVAGYPDRRTAQMSTRSRAGVEVTKEFSLGEDYVLSGRIVITRPHLAESAGRKVELVIGTAAPADVKESPMYLGVDWMAGLRYQNRGVKHAEKGGVDVPKREPVEANWAAVKSQFFTMVLTPATNAAAVAYQRIDLIPPLGWKGKQPPHGLCASLESIPTSVVGDMVDTYEFTYYAGPKEYERLVALGKGQEEIMQFGFWGVISVALLKSMKFFYNVVPNYGVVIILITIIIKILFWPIQAKSIKSMKQMQKFQPLMQKLREKYKDDAQRMNAEMMKLYKEHKINPFAGCLPMLVQIPVFFALFTMLRSAVELRGAAFLWIKDLSHPDTILHVLGFPLNPLPLLMGASMIWQMKLTPQTGDPKQQQMMLFMPVVFLFICYNMASGLVLYWTVQQLLSIAQQWWSMRQTDHPAAPAPALPARGAGKAK